MIVVVKMFEFTNYYDNAPFDGHRFQYKLPTIDFPFFSYHTDSKIFLNYGIKEHTRITYNILLEFFEYTKDEL